MAILADTRAVRLLLNLRGQDKEKEQQLLDRAGDNTTDRVSEATQSTLAYPTTRAPEAPTTGGSPKAPVICRSPLPESIDERVS